MKKVLIILSILLLTGCGFQDKTTMTINSDKSLNIEVLKTADNELIDKAINEKYETNKTYTDKERWKYIDDTIIEGMKDYPDIIYEKYENGEYKGYKFKYEISNIDEVTSEDASFNISNFLNISSSKLFKKEDNKYISKLSFTGTDIIEDVDYDLSFSVTLPNEPISHNATTISEDKKTLTWNLVTPTDGEIKFEFSFENNNENQKEKSNKNIIIGISAAIVTLIIVTIIILKIRKKEEF